MPGLARKLDSYEASRPNLRARIKDLNDLIRREANTLNPEDGWQVGNVIRAGNQYTRLLVDHPGQPDPMLRFERSTLSPDRSGSVPRILQWMVPMSSVQMSGFFVWSSVTADPSDLTPLNSVAERIRQSDEYQNVKDAVAEIVKSRQAAITDLEAILARETILAREGFPGRCSSVCWQADSTAPV